MKGTKFFAGLLAGLSVVLGASGLAACGGTDSSSSSSEDTQPKGVLYEVVDDTAQVVGYDGEESIVTIEEMYEGVLVTKIGDNAFKNSTITSVEIPDTITVIGDSAFYGCASLTEIVIPEEVTVIGNSAFYGCEGLTEIVIPESVTSIGNFAFENCSGFTQIVIPDSVTSIGKSAFCNCTSLISVTIGSGVKSIGGEAFAFSTALKDITFMGTKTQWTKINIANDWLTQVNEVTKIVCSDGEVKL